MQGMVPGMVGLTGMAGLQGMGGGPDVTTKTQRELFVGNTPVDTSEAVLIEFLNEAMRKVNLVTQPGNPILQCRVSNKFAFIELRSVEETNACLNINGIPFMGNMLKVGRPTKYTGPPGPPATTWQQLTGVGQDVSAIDPNTKIFRELFIGNTSPEMTEVDLQEFLGSAMKAVGLSTEPGNPIVTTRLSGKFAFAELRSVDETNACLNLNGIPYLNMNLRVGRPSRYSGPDVAYTDWPVTLQRWQEKEAMQQQQAAMATRVIKLGNMVTEADLANDEEYADIVEDTREEDVVV